MFRWKPLPMPGSRFTGPNHLGPVPPTLAFAHVPEGFLEVLQTRVNQPGFYLMDEPDAPLSFTSCLGLVALLHDLVQDGSQAVIATHSPIVAAVPAQPSWS